MIRTLRNLFTRQFEDTETLYVLFFLVGASISALIISAVAHVFSSPTNWATWVEGLFQNFASEIIGAIATYSLFELILGKRNEQRRLITEMKSPDLAVAKTAMEQLRDNHGLVNGSLNEMDLSGLQLPSCDMKNAQMQGAILINSNLAGTDLSSAVLEAANLANSNLSRANFWLANLQRANLQDTNLAEADMRLAEMQETVFRRANLRSARLVQAKLGGADFANADLRHAYLLGANLHGANLASANLEGAHFDPNTILPDGTNWTAKTDMSRFTNSEHPSFWKRDQDNEGYTTTSLSNYTPPQG